MNPQPPVPAPVVPFVFTPVAPHSHQASLTIDLNIKIAYVKYGTSTEEQNRSYLDRFAKVCERATERWPSVCVRNRFELTAAHWNLGVNSWLPQLDSRFPSVPSEQLWRYGVVGSSITHYLPVTVSLLFLLPRPSLTFPSA